MISVPANINSLIKYYFDHHYIKIISLSFLVSLISFFGGFCFNVRKQIKKVFLLSLIALSCLTAFIFRDALLYEKNLLVFFLILMGVLCNSINIGYLELKLASGRKIIFLLFLAGLFLAANFFYKKAGERIVLDRMFWRLG